MIRKTIGVLLAWPLLAALLSAFGRHDARDFVQCLGIVAVIAIAFWGVLGFVK